MSNFVCRRNFFILLSLKTLSLFCFSIMCAEDQLTDLPPAPETAIIQRIQELCAPENEAIAHNFKQEPFFKEFKETIKKITKKIIKENPELYTTLLSDIEKSFFAKRVSLGERALVIFDSHTLIRWLTTCIKDACFLLSVQFLFSLSDEFPANQRNEIIKSDLCAMITSSVVQLAIIEFLMFLQKKHYGYYCIRAELTFDDYFITWMIAVIIQALNPRCRSEKMLAGRFLATIAKWLAFPFVCKRVIEQCRSCSNKNHVQEVKQSLQSLLEKYEELLELEKSKEQVCTEQRAVSSTQI